MTLGRFHECLWVTNGLLCGLVVLLGLQKCRVKSFPIFFAFLTWDFLAFLVQFSMHYVRSETISYWCMFLVFEISFPFELILLYKLANALIISQNARTRLLRPFLEKILAVLPLPVTVLVAVTPAVSRVRVTQLLEHLSLAQDAIEFGLLVALAFFARVLAIRWRTFPAGIAIGWGVSSIVNIGSMLLLSHRSIGFLLMATMRQGGFMACLLIWIWYVLQPEANLRIGQQLPIVDLNQSAEELQGILRRKPSTGF